MLNILLIVILLAIAGAIVFYLIREKKRGVCCVGCPHAKACAKKHASGGCRCGNHETE
jgi:hypothetical protein